MIILGIIVLLIIVLLANVGLDEDWAQSSTRLLIFAVNGSIALFSIVILISSNQPIPAAFLADIDPQLAQAFQRVAFQIGMVGITTALAATLIWLGPARRALAGSMHRLHLGNFDGESPLDITALVLSFYLMALIMVQWLVAGGASGLADLAGPVRLGDALLSGLLAVSFAVMGVGLGVRRSWPEALQRLGVIRPGWRNVGAGIGTAIGLLAFLLLVSSLWFTLAPESFQALGNATDALFSEFNSLPLAVAVALSSAIGEEVLFRGALQPRFGLIPTTLLFAVLHVQYTLSPAALIIFGVGLGLGLLRQQQNTTAAIVAHFVYNFSLLAVAILAPQI